MEGQSGLEAPSACGFPCPRHLPPAAQHASQQSSFMLHHHRRHRARSQRAWRQMTLRPRRRGPRASCPRPSTRPQAPRCPRRQSTVRPLSMGGRGPGGWPSGARPSLKTPNGGRGTSVAAPWPSWVAPWGQAWACHALALGVGLWVCTPVPVVMLTAHGRMHQGVLSSPANNGFAGAPPSTRSPGPPRPAPCMYVLPQRRRASSTFRACAAGAAPATRARAPPAAAQTWRRCAPRRGRQQSRRRCVRVWVCAYVAVLLLYLRTAVRPCTGHQPLRRTGRYGACVQPAREALSAV